MDQFNDETTPLTPQEEAPMQPQQPVSEQPAYQPPAPPQQPVSEQPAYQPPVPPQQPVYQQSAYDPQQPMYQQPYQAAYQPPYQPEAPAPKKKSALKIVLPIVIVLLVAAAVAVYFLFFSGTPIEEIDLEDSALTLAIDDTATLDYDITPADATETELTWKSSDESVATVSGGKVIAKGEGTCTITVTAESGVKDTCKITVEPPIAEEDARLLGKWEVTMTYFDGELENFYGNQAYMVLNDDMTGTFYLGNDTYEIISWGYTASSNGTDIYSVRMEVLGSISFGYSTDASSSIYGQLLMFLDSQNMLVLEKS